MTNLTSSAPTVTVTLTDPDNPNDPPMEERTFTDAHEAEAFITDIASRLFILDDERHGATGNWFGFTLTAMVNDD